MRVGVIDYFDSMHLLPGHPKCGVPHGHTYRVEVEVSGEPVGGMVIDFALLKEALQETLSAFDHTDLNALLPFPSCENLASEIHRRLKPRLQGKAIRVRIWEGDGKWAELEA
jgi:6-pyruvoyltetrahydropterin/6-carboxytetrahydropterin synthase